MASMSAAHTSVTGFTTIPFGERMARPKGRRIRRSWWERMLLQRRERRAEDRAWNARRSAESADAPSVTHPHDGFSVGHPGAEIHLLDTAAHTKIGELEVQVCHSM